MHRRLRTARPGLSYMAAIFVQPIADAISDPSKFRHGIATMTEPGKPPCTSSLAGTTAAPWALGLLLIILDLVELVDLQ